MVSYTITRKAHYFNIVSPPRRKIIQSGGSKNRKSGSSHSLLEPKFITFQFLILVSKEQRN
jgi:hypothetical protein